MTNSHRARNGWLDLGAWVISLPNSRLICITCMCGCTHHSRDVSAVQAQDSAETGLSTQAPLLCSSETGVTMPSCHETLKLGASPRSDPKT